MVRAVRAALTVLALQSRIDLFQAQSSGFLGRSYAPHVSASAHERAYVITRSTESLSRAESDTLPFVRRLLVASVALACRSPALVSPPPANQAAPVGAADQDDDGIADDRDTCRDQPEDYDLFADEDGCPDPDNDRDGVPDLADECPYDAGEHRGCVVPCTIFVTSSDDCFTDPTVFYDAHDLPHPARIAAIVDLVRANPSVRALEVTGARAELVAAPLRTKLPSTTIAEEHRDIGKSAVWVRITKQRFAEGRFRTMQCTPFGPIYRPARADNCTR